MTKAEQLIRTSYVREVYVQPKIYQNIMRYGQFLDREVTVDQHDTWRGQRETIYSYQLNNRVWEISVHETWDHENRSHDIQYLVYPQQANSRLLSPAKDQHFYQLLHQPPLILN